MTTDISVLVVKPHAAKRYAQRVWKIRRPTVKQIESAMAALRFELRRATQVEADHIDIGEHQEAYRLANCVVYVRQGMNISTLVTHHEYNHVLEVARLRGEV